MAPSSTSVFLMASSVVLVAAAAQFFPGSSSRQHAGGATDITEEDEIITEELLVKIFDRLFLEMQMVLQQLSQHVQQIQSTGQMIPESQLRKILTSEYERALMDRQSKIFEDHDVDADCIEEATWEFMEDEERYPKAKRAVERFQKLYESVSGESVVGRRPGIQIETKHAKVLSSEETIEAATVYFGALSNAMKGLAEKFKAEGKNLQDPAVNQEFQMKFASLANEAGDEALEAKGITTKDFQASIEKNATDPQVGRKLQMLQMQQQQELIGVMS
mmetsp:Transcript_16435/g.24852  ORF Transcript_16435/g.24852 Transcript_16435/m.24852 type:complete len:275 (+) Transcript_16435:146-970(+)|eukprot:CAMPEP_0178926486 /NCGR_PEP_ID=MMETSP0786-20121207/18562_1 /TAXON_ID=186022 /ORGANISM="Thalassionema frauenfeldii, Strain CCMP 1798" /LENGTH=274 /DNA_ID=CAMNT_0020601619 /DNA_START=138 /DNA_END=962 /DNA_ORIENTATION=-